jgi:hypothetical protein
LDKYNFNDIVYNSAYVSDKMIGTLIVGKCIARDVIFMSSLWGSSTELLKGYGVNVHETKSQLIHGKQSNLL